MRITNDTKNKKYVGAGPVSAQTSKARQNKGITLIALIITIIVMLILVAVTINMAINGGLFGNAGKALGETQNATNEEQQLANGKVQIDGVWYDSIDDYLAGNFSWTEILAEANVNPEAYKHKDQLVSTYIGIGTDGEPVNMDLWNPTLLDDGTYLLGGTANLTQSTNTYKGSYDGGKIEGKVPQYIHNANTATFEPVTQMRGTFSCATSLMYAPEIPTTVSNSEYLFYGCTKLETIPSSITSIGQYAFLGCTGLTSITIPDSVTSIGNYAFQGCTGLTSVTISSNVTSIGNQGFYGCTSLTNVTIPSGVTSIGNYAFLGCTGLTNVTIPNSVKSTGFSAFYGCTGLTSITISDGVTIIEQMAFSGCTGLTNITIPSSVTSIGNSAFSGCTGLTSITISDGVTSIEYSAFYGCTGLTSVTIPYSVTSIGNYAFHGCTGLTSIKVDEANTKYDSRDNCNAIIETSTNTLVVGCKNTTIPSSVTSIEDMAFYGCTGLTSVTIPSSITSIGNYAFRGCTGLTSITIPSSVTSIGDIAFYGCTGLTSVYFEHTTAPIFGSRCFIKTSGNKTTFYFKNSTVYDAFTTDYYNSTYGTKSTNYNW